MTADQRPRVLLLAPWPPYPFDGGSKRVHTVCRLLRDRFHFTLLTFRPHEESREAREVADDLFREARFLRTVFDDIHWVPVPVGEPPERADGLWLPGDVRRFWSEAMRARLSELAAASDLVHVEFDLMAPYARDLRGVPVVWTQHDAGTLSFFQSYFREMAGWRKFLRVGEWARRVRFEREASRWFDRIVTLTPGDARRMSKIADPARIKVVPTGVDLACFDDGGAAEEASRGETVTYLGHYPHFPNEDAVLYFCRSILPRILERRPGVTFEVVGSSPTPEVLRLAEDHCEVRVTGTVDDVRPYLRRAAVFVAPLRTGQGIKGKILEAFAMGRPVVATSRAADGLEAEPGRDLLVADDPRAFAARVVELLEDPGLRRRIGANGRAVARRLYDWRRLADGLGEVYRGLLGERACVGSGA